MKFSGKFDKCLFITETSYGIRFADDLYYQTNYSNVWMFKDYYNYITKHRNVHVIKNFVSKRIAKGLEGQL